MFNYKTVHCFFWFCLFYCPVSKKPYARRGSNRDHSLWVQRNLQWVVGAGRGVSVEVWMALKVNDRVYSECIFIEQQLESTPLSLSLSLPLLSLSFSSGMAYERNHARKCKTLNHGFFKHWRGHLHWNKAKHAHNMGFKWFFAKHQNVFFSNCENP